MDIRLIIFDNLQMNQPPNKHLDKLPTYYFKENTFKVDLTEEEMALIQKFLPKSYSFQIQPHSKKDCKSQNKKKNTQDLHIQSHTQMHHTIPKPLLKNVTPNPTLNVKKTKIDQIPEAVKPCIKILESLKSHKSAWPFIDPVDADGLGIPEYKEIVKDPMDLTTMEKKLKAGKYQTPAQFHSEVVKIIHNSYLFNEINEDFKKITQEFQRYYYRISGQSKPVIEKIPIIKPIVVPPIKTLKKKKRLPAGSRELNESQPITLEEKKQLAYNIHRLAKEHLKGIRSIVFETNSDQNEFDIEQLPPKKIRQLQKYIRSKINDMESNLRHHLLDRNQQKNLDDMQSDMTSEFLDESYEKDEI